MFPYTLGEALIVFFIVGLGMVGSVMLFSWAVRPLSRQSDTYECGMIAEGEHRALGFGYLNYALLFLVFDLAALYLFLYAYANALPLSMTVGFFCGIALLCILIIYGTQKRRYYAA